MSVAGFGRVPVTVTTPGDVAEPETSLNQPRPNLPEANPKRCRRAGVTPESVRRGEARRETLPLAGAT